MISKIIDIEYPTTIDENINTIRIKISSGEAKIVSIDGTLISQKKPPKSSNYYSVNFEPSDNLKLGAIIDEVENLIVKIIRPSSDKCGDVVLTQRTLSGSKTRAMKAHSTVERAMVDVVQLGYEVFVINKNGKGIVYGLPDHSDESLKSDENDETVDSESESTVSSSDISSDGDCDTSGELEESDESSKSTESDLSSDESDENPTDSSSEEYSADLSADDSTGTGSK